MIARVLSTTFGLSLMVGLPEPAVSQERVVSESFRGTMRLIAAASDLTPLDSAATPDGVLRELRLYVPFRSPSRMIRIWEDARGVHGAFGIYWRRAERLARAGADRSASALFLAADSAVRELADSAYQCNRFTHAGFVEVCWLQPHATDDWPKLLALLDSASVGTIPDLAPPDTIAPRIIYRDGWGIVVEVRTGGGYRAYGYAMPSASSARADVRAAAAVAEAMDSAWKRRIGR